MNPVRLGIHAALAGGFALVPIALSGWWVASAHARLVEDEQAANTKEQAATAAAANNDTYCTPVLKKVLRRVVQSCGLLSDGQVRGCQPVAAKAITAMAGDDFNALFRPLADRAAIIQYDLDSDKLDAAGEGLLKDEFANQGGASFFFVVARASPDGDPTYNRDLSQRRGNAILDYLHKNETDPDLDHEVGLLWLGADQSSQLDKEFCSWKRSRGGDCDVADLNRSAFVTWIDCAP